MRLREVFRYEVEYRLRSPSTWVYAGLLFLWAIWMFLATADDPENAFINAPYGDLRVEFTLADGSTRTVKPAGGSGTAMLFQSPDDVPVASLRQVALYVNDTAEWTQ